jgi:putative transposase
MAPISRGFGGAGATTSIRRAGQYDAHEGLKNAIAKVLGAPWGRCTVHFLRRLPRARPPRSARAAGCADPPDRQRREPRGGARQALRSGRHPGGRHAAQGRRRCARPPNTTSWPSTRFRPTTGASSQAPIRLSVSTARSDAELTSSGSFPDDRSLSRLASMLAIEQNDEWLVGRRYLSAASMGPLLKERPPATHRRGGPRAPAGLSSHPHHRRHELPALTSRPGT